MLTTLDVDTRTTLFEGEANIKGKGYDFLDEKNQTIDISIF